MRVMAAGKAKNAFGLLIDTARAEPVTIKKHGRAVAVEDYERLMALKAAGGAWRHTSLRNGVGCRKEI